MITHGGFLLSIIANDEDKEKLNSRDTACCVSTVVKLIKKPLFRAVVSKVCFHYGIGLLFSQSFPIITSMSA
jgi:hypothetical protein